MQPNYPSHSWSISESEKTGSKQSSPELVAARMLLERRPVSAAQQSREIKAANPERMGDHTDDREVNCVREKHESDSEYYRQHRRLISVSAALDGNASCDSHRELVSEAAPRSCERDEPLVEGALPLSDVDSLRERQRCLLRYAAETSCDLFSQVNVVGSRPRVHLDRFPDTYSNDRTRYALVLEYKSERQDRNSLYGTLIPGS